MIDTLALTLRQDMFQITNPEKFTPSARWIEDFGKSIHGMKSKQNPTKKELLHGIYKPRLTFSYCFTSARTRELMLRVELSLPKLLFGNNFDELQYKDFKLLIEKLATTLETMGVIVSTDTLSQAPVCAIHYSKNIALTDGSIPFSYINRIKEANARLSLDTNESTYRNDGHGYKWHCNAYEVAFYDKIKDLEKAKQSCKLTIEKDSELQLSIIDSFAHRHRLEYLRMEVRLNKREMIKRLFKKLNIKSNLTFKNLFKPAIAKKVLLHYLDEIERNRLPLLDFKAKNDQALLAALCINNPQLNPKQILQMFGLKKSLELYTIRELRTMFCKCNSRSWYRLMADAKKLNLPATESPLSTLRESIMKFKPTKLSNIAKKRYISMYNFQHIPEQEKAAQWFLLLEPLIRNRASRPNPETSPLLIVLNNKWKNPKVVIEFALKNCKNADQIFSRSSEIKSEQNPDNIIDDMFSELRAIQYLVQKGFSDITYHKKNSVDFTATIQGNTIGIEVAYIHGPNFKTQEIYPDATNKFSPVYKLGSHNTINRLISIYQKKEKQITNHGYNQSNAIILIVSDLQELYAPWLDHELIENKHPVEYFVLNCFIPTVIFAPGTIYEPNNEALNGLFGELTQITPRIFQKPM